MALYFTRTLCLCPLRLLAVSNSHFMCQYLHQAKDDTGAIDEFTSQLVEQKSSKWEKRRHMAQKNVNVNRPRLAVTNITITIDNESIKNLDGEQINDLFQRTFDDPDSSMLVSLIKQCIRHDKIPSMAILINALSVCSRIGDKETIVEVSQLCEKLRPEGLQENSHFEHYIAEAVWVKGDVTKSLKIFERVYRENFYLRRKIRTILKHLILDSVANHSEATIVNLTKFSEMLIKEYNDYFTLSCLWQACILSEWFSDQQTALGLLEKYAKLGDLIIYKIPLIVRVSLKNHRTEIVYRLTETLLKLNMKLEVSHVLLQLLDYWIKQGDFRQCKEIIMWSFKNNIELPAVIANSKFMKLFENELKGVEFGVKSGTSRQAPQDFKF